VSGSGSWGWAQGARVGVRDGAPRLDLDGGGRRAPPWSEATFALQAVARAAAMAIFGASGLGRSGWRQCQGRAGRSVMRSG
jgi:hypothetical protein